MKLVLLAAGKSTRMGVMCKNNPKILIRLNNGLTLLEHYIRIAEAVGDIDEIVIVTGYNNFSIEKKINEIKHEIRIQTVFNPFYDISGPIISLWLTCSIMKENDFIIANGDTFFNYEVFKQFVMSANSTIMHLAVSKSYLYKDDDVKVRVDEKKRITNISKELNKERANGLSAGLVMIAGLNNRIIIVNKIQELVYNKEYLKPGHIWHEIFDQLLKEGITINPIFIDRNNWQEIDNVDDLLLSSIRVI